MKPAIQVARLTGLWLASLLLTLPVAEAAVLVLPRDGWVSWQVPAVADATGLCFG